MLDLSESDVVLVSVLAHGIFGAGRHGGNERRLRMNVIVEPDSTTGWFTVPGVVLGALLTTGATWLQRRSGDRKGSAAR
jgi:hypothetical protein